VPGSPDKDTPDNTHPGMDGSLTIQRRKDRPIRTAVKDGVIVALVLMGLTACQGKRAAPAPGGAPPPGGRPSAAAYRTPPAVTTATLAPGGRVRLVGRADPGDSVRLTTPAGPAAYALAGKDGVWRLMLPPAAEPRLYGLAMFDHGRAVQSEGYIAVTPRGTAAQLRAGAGALVMGERAPGPAILAVDFDSKGGTVVSGRASPRAVVDLWVDGVRRGRGGAGPDGLFSVALDEPLSFDDHQMAIVDGARRAEARPRLTAPQPLSGGPYRATEAPGGWRIDWMTPGGGLQTTLLLTGEAGAS